MSEMYNAELKEKFLEKYESEATRNHYWLRLRDFSATEKILQKDIFNFLWKKFAYVIFRFR